MINPDLIAKVLLETFDMSAAAMFRAWLAQHGSIRKWMLAADFLLQDQAQPNHCFAFTVFPIDGELVDILADIRANLPHDLKDNRTLDERAIKWLRDPRRFHFVILVPKDRAIFGIGNDARVVARDIVKETIAWMRQRGRATKDLRRMLKLREKMSANAFNMRRFTDVILLAILFPVLTIMLARERRCEDICWMSDRDPMLDLCEGVVWTLAMENLAGLSAMLGVETFGLRVGLALPDRSSGKEVMWFDDCIRPADWFAGTLSVWDRETNLVPAHHDKYALMLCDVVADSRNVIMLPLRLDGSQVRASRLVLSMSGAGLPTFPLRPDT